MSDKQEKGELQIQQVIEAYRSELNDDFIMGLSKKLQRHMGVKRSTLQTSSRAAAISAK